jgi:hypothetical protein
MSSVAHDIYKLYLDTELKDLSSWRTFSVFLVAILVDNPEYPEYWEPVFRKAKALTRSNSKRTLVGLKSSLNAALDKSKVTKVAVDSLSGSDEAYKAREVVFMQRIHNPRLFTREVDLLEDFTKEVEQPTINSDTIDYKGREDVFTERIKRPGSFRRGPAPIIQVSSRKGGAADRFN